MIPITHSLYERYVIGMTETRLDALKRILPPRQHKLPSEPEWRYLVAVDATLPASISLTKESHL